MKKVYYCYAEEDTELCQELERHLAILRRECLISEWHKRMIEPGKVYSAELRKNLENADIFLLLYSADLFADDKVFRAELQDVLERQRSGQVIVIPILIRQVSLGKEFANSVQLPDNGVPVTSWQNRDEAWSNVARGIRRSIAGVSAEAEPVSKYREMALARTQSEYLATFHAEDPGLSETDLWGTCTPFIELSWEERAPEQVQDVQRKHSHSKARVLAMLPWRRNQRHRHASKTLAAVLLRSVEGKQKVAAALPWIIHCGPGGGKTTTVLRALAEVAQKAKQQGTGRVIPVYVRLAGIAAASLTQLTQQPASDASLAQMVHRFARDAERLRYLIEQDNTARLAVVLDGLDEIPQADIRRSVLEWAIAGASKFCASNSLALTCRTLDFPVSMFGSHRLFWLRPGRPRVQHMYLLPPDAAWQDSWIQARCARDHQMWRWLAEQLRQLRDSVLSDPRLTRASFFNSPFLFVGLSLWLLSERGRNPDWEPTFPNHNDVLTRLIIDYSITGAAEYIQESRAEQSSILDAAEWTELRKAVCDVLSQLALEQLINPSERWDMAEEAVVATLGQHTEYLSEPARDSARLVLDKSRLLPRITDGTQLPRRAYAHPLILENLAAQQLAQLITHATDSPANGMAIQRAVSVIWSARCIPTAVRLLGQATIPKELFYGLKKCLLRTELSTDLNGVVPADARTILLETLIACPENDLLTIGRAHGFSLSSVLMESMQNQRDSVSADDLSRTLLILEGALQAEHESGLLSLRQAFNNIGLLSLRTFSLWLRTGSNHVHFAQSLAKIWELIIKFYPGTNDPIGPYQFSRFKCPANGRGWPFYASSAETRSVLQDIEDKYYSHSRRNAAMVKDAFLWCFGGAVLGAIGYGIIPLLAKYTYPESENILDRLPAPNGIISLLTTILAGVCLSVLPIFGVIQSFVIPLRWISGRWQKMRFKVSSEKLWAAAKDETINETDALNWIDGFSCQPLTDQKEALRRLDFLAKAYAEAKRRPSKIMISAQILSSADSIRKEFQSMRQEQLQGHRGTMIVENSLESAIDAEPGLRDAIHRDELWLSYIDIFLLVLMGAVGAGLFGHYQHGRLLVLCGLPPAILVLHLIGGQQLVSSLRRQGYTPSLAFYLLLVLLYAAFNFGILSVTLHNTARFEESAGNLRTDLVDLAISRMQLLCLDGLLFFVPLILTITAAHTILSYLFLELPRDAALKKHGRRLLISLALSGILTIIIGTCAYVAGPGGRPNPHKILAIHHQEIIDGYPTDSIIGSVLTSLQLETRLVISQRTKQGTRQEQGLHRALDSYLDALCQRSIADWRAARDGLMARTRRRSVSFAELIGFLDRNFLLTKRHYDSLACISEAELLYGLKSQKTK